MMAKRIVTNPKVLQGKPIVEGTRISVSFILQLLGSGMNADQIAAEYPNLAIEDVFSAVEYARVVGT